MWLSFRRKERDWQFQFFKRPSFNGHTHFSLNVTSGGLLSPSLFRKAWHFISKILLLRWLNCPNVKRGRATSLFFFVGDCQMCFFAFLPGLQVCEEALFCLLVKVSADTSVKFWLSGCGAWSCSPWEPTKFWGNSIWLSLESSFGKSAPKNNSVFLKKWIKITVIINL